MLIGSRKGRLVHRAHRVLKKTEPTEFKGKGTRLYVPMVPEPGSEFCLG